jgi:pyridoxamine 5'-phosphate oxidase
MAIDPLVLFEQWFAEARSSESELPEAMALATADDVGNPSVRMVLLKGYGPEGFAFYTNTASVKGQHLSQNPSAALLFYWKSLRRQVRIEGRVEAVSTEESDAYFATRPRDAQLGAWASDQSRPLESREAFEARYEEMRRRFDGQPVPRPPHWSGYRVVPLCVEFWQDRPHRLHERQFFQAQEDGSWASWLLYP